MYLIVVSNVEWFRLRAKQKKYLIFVIEYIRFTQRVPKKKKRLETQLNMIYTISFLNSFNILNTKFVW